jgi:hypothetical protein
MEKLVAYNRGGPQPAVLVLVIATSSGRVAVAAVVADLLRCF